MGYSVPMLERSLRHLEEMAIFAKVGELGSVSAAGRALKLPKSTVSRAVSKLEAVFAARLVERTTRGLNLTELGRALHAHCRNLVSEAQNAEAEIAAYQGNPRGRLRVAAPYALGHMVLKNSLPRFLDEYPDIDLQLQLTDRLLNPVMDDFDVVIRVGWLEDSGVTGRKITDIDAVLLASPAYVQTHGLPQSAQDLETHAIVGFPIPEPRAITLANGQDRIKVPIWRRFACNDPLMNLEFVQRGLAIAPVSSFVAASLLRDGALVRVLPAYTLLDQPTVHALYGGRTAISPKIAVFLDHLTEVARLLRSGAAVFAR
jgi:DNA-binding transcriptional LysR family regulator